MTAVSEHAVEKLMSIGARNQWYAMCPSHFVTEKPVSLRRCGYRMVFWRGIDGTPYALEDRCPHRGVPLSCGILMNDRIACGYHGVQVDKNGVAVVVPGAPGSKLEGSKATKTFPLQERNGVIFAYVGDELHPEAPELILPEELSSPEFSSFLCYAEWNGDYRYVIDNVMDPMHGTFLHKQSHSMSFGDTQANFRIRDTQTGFVFEKEGQRNVNFDWTEYANTNALWLRLEIPYPKSGGPGGNFHIIGMYTPISENKAVVIHWRCRKVDGWHRDTWRFLYKNRLEARHWHVLEQDRTMLEQCDPDANKHENLYSHDMGLVRLRRVMKNQAVQQLTALAEAGRQVA
ncbi:aromatic ring-hydroxylating dioxygenase subunit alpha [Roseiarcaceae bacterium H3SJ34-1]|uniref:Rieske 2Fe-2S domain-containing protein n=1 Tax=Terripilifer ovatus TaxID=3032367 RepID=UPI003AB9A8C8|nr:aromatic ring-hydroxylating dioxygenase subunit alpha [Roseiarcaceae bacterium H3SJ34-1]